VRFPVCLSLYVDVTCCGQMLDFDQVELNEGWIGWNKHFIK